MDGGGVIDAKPVSVAVLAMGGQGGGVLVDWIVRLAEAAGWCAQATSVPGVAQRTGATLYYVELLALPPGGFGNRTPVLSLMPDGAVDLLVGAELMEAGRGMLRGLASPERTLLVASTHRALAVSEKMPPADGAGDPLAVLDAARASCRRVVALDMQVLALRSGSAVSAVLFGAIAAADGLPFPPARFEDAIRSAGIGVEASLRAFAAGFAAAGSVGVRPPGPPAKVFPSLAPSRHVALEALRTRLERFPPAARPMLAAGLARVVDYQDPAYGAQYLDRVWQLHAWPGLLLPAAQHVAAAMAYDDVFRTADLKTRGTRAARVRGEVAARADQLVATTEFMHPGVAELVGMLPARLGAAVERSPSVLAAIGRLARGRQVRTGRLHWFLPLYVVAGLRRHRRSTLRHARETAHVDAWLERVLQMAQRDEALAGEMLHARRLVKGYSDTHARGLGRFDMVMAAAARLAGRADAASWVGRLIAAALRDASGAALADTLRTIDSFL